MPCTKTKLALFQSRASVTLSSGLEIRYPASVSVVARVGSRRGLKRVANWWTRSWISLNCSKCNATSELGSCSCSLRISDSHWSKKAEISKFRLIQKAKKVTKVLNSRKSKFSMRHLKTILKRRLKLVSWEISHVIKSLAALPPSIRSSQWGAWTLLQTVQLSKILAICLICLPISKTHWPPIICSSSTNMKTMKTLVRTRSLMGRPWTK